MKQIIIADDSSLARMFTARCLTVAGFTDFEITEAKDGQEVFALMTEAKPDLVITDLNMPEMDGLELLQHISKTSNLSDTPVIVVTSAGSGEQREQMISLGAIAVLSKPITPTDISEAIGALLSKGESFYD